MLLIVGQAHTFMKQPHICARYFNWKRTGVTQNKYTVLMDFNAFRILILLPVGSCLRQDDSIVKKIILKQLAMKEQVEENGKVSSLGIRSCGLPS
jgi:hypothetical protein